MGKPKQIEVQSVTDEIAQNIKTVADAMKALNASGLQQKTIVILLQEAIGSKYITRDQIRYVLDELPKLDKTYLKDWMRKS